MIFLITLAISIVSALVGWWGVQITGNYENTWGAMLFWSVPVGVVLGLILAVL